MKGVITNRIRERRESLGYRLEDVADKMGVSIPTVQRYESKPIGKLTVEQVTKIAEVLRMDISNLLGIDRGDLMEQQEIKMMRLFRGASAEGKEAALRLLGCYQDTDKGVKKGGA
jgi:transcriptional regulator with XRE-family HTH domain